MTHLGSGRYEVTFSANVSRCAYIATIIRNPISNPSLAAVQVFTAGGHLSHDGVYVETKNVGSGLTDGPFNLVVDCGGPGWSFAVVGYGANLVRSSPGTTLTNFGRGRYDVTFNHNISNCAYLAQVGDPGNSMVVGPVRVYTGSASNPDAVYIETKNVGGGLDRGILVPPGGHMPDRSQHHNRGRRRQRTHRPRIKPDEFLLADDRTVHGSHRHLGIRLCHGGNARIGGPVTATRPDHRRAHPRTSRQHRWDPGHLAAGRRTSRCGIPRGDRLLTATTDRGRPLARSLRRAPRSRAPTDRLKRGLSLLFNLCCPAWLVLPLLSGVSP